MKNQVKKNKLPNILTLKQACEFLNCHPNTLRNWDNKDILKAIRFGKRGDRRYKKEDILKLIKK
ncbi:MAG: DNA-binding protein [Parcubacteria group bacterium CG11_big_fil_rev_8_21_14_0_20_39_14]|nr:MAG: DNA-binding protein [Parcubacteria group bacterium CG11_big_fil_rev_8_21_14_0_20_39_14]PIS35882.1 MAG: DNA-binding protein [Parcubacteria group bacterium CG08_land_8_20_14_0_20_38_56]